MLKKPRDKPLPLHFIEDKVLPLKKLKETHFPMCVDLRNYLLFLFPAQHEQGVLTNIENFEHVALKEIAGQKKGSP